MKLRCVLGTLGLGMVLSLGSLQAQQPSGIDQANWWNRPGQCCPPATIVPTMPQGSGSASGSGTGAEAQPATDQNLFASAELGGSGAAESAMPGMFGDLIGFVGRKVITTTTTTTTPPIFRVGAHPIPGTTTTTTTFQNVFVPAAGGGASGFKISDNESPRPEDRVFFTYNYYNAANRGFNDPSVGTMDVHRELFGFEKTFLDGAASIGLRLPIIQTTGGGFDDSQFGDISIVTKYAFYDDRHTGNLLSGGLVITVPTGQSFADPYGGSSINPVLIQPWLGYIFNFGDAYIHGFAGIEVPTDTRDVVLLSNDIGLGYWLYRNNLCDRMLRAVVPTFELHLNDPLTNRYPSENAIFMADQLNLTAGANFIFGQHGSSLGLAVGVPVLGPMPYTIEGLVQFNLRF